MTSPEISIKNVDNRVKKKVSLADFLPTIGAGGGGQQTPGAPFGPAGPAGPCGPGLPAGPAGPKNRNQDKHKIIIQNPNCPVN